MTEQVMQPGASQWIGKPLRRLEDAKLLTGQGSFTDDVQLAGAVHAAFVRSPHAHARIASLDVSAARAAPGVFAVFTGADVIAAGLAPVPFTQLHKRPDGAGMTVPPRHALTPDVARFVGDAVAMVVAGTRDQARDAAELVEVDWQPLAANADLPRAVRADAPVHWAPAFTPEYGNIAAIYRMGDRAAAEAAFAAAAHVVRLRVVNNRVTASPLEPRALAAQYDTAGGRFTLHCPTQNTHTVRGQLAKVFGVEEDRLRIVCTDLGGGFGARGYAYPEHAALCFAARALGRPVKWRADRSENFLSEVHGRDSVTEAELAIDREQRFTALRVRTLANIGAYASNFGACVPAMSGVRAPTGVYDIALLDHEVKMVFTNTAPVDAYRGAGRPEMGYLLERLVSRAARDLNADPVALRLKNMLKPAQMPWKNPAGQTYDCGDFPRMLREAVAAADWEGFAARKADAARRGRLYGRGLGCYVEITGSARVSETVIVMIDADGAVTLVSGTQQIGQGIQTSYAQIVAELLGVAPESVRVIQGDTDVAKTGGGAGGSRSLQVGGSAALVGARALVEAGKSLAAKELEAAAVDIEFAGGRYRIAGTDRSIGLAELAGRQPQRRISIAHTETVKGQTWPNGCQICEAEVDPDTGAVRLVRLSAVDDVGRVLNPLIAEGQVHGGMMQGIGQALMEQSVYDGEGQLLTGSFMDYAMPRADALPELATGFDESVPSALNPLGAKGVGEAGTHGAMPAVVNAVLDALAERGVAEIDMPLTPEKVWRALARAPGRAF
ncbi:MAG TPA: xanthine dehydrogenase family protein molybdopterin-binding subunit [Burkholderiales bacterium]|nr:xanthine dehydrogenase family protein molybdopterin-binding subunit [Burkholderiales bacterium]